MRTLTGLALVTVSLAARGAHAQAQATVPASAPRTNAFGARRASRLRDGRDGDDAAARLAAAARPRARQRPDGDGRGPRRAPQPRSVGVHGRGDRQRPRQRRPEQSRCSRICSTAASSPRPLLGAPQGLSMYLDGVRLNEPFGDTINWDLIPTNAIRSVNVIPGSNPIFGLNTLGGALSLETKTGFSDPGADGTLLYGSWGRKLARASARRARREARRLRGGPGLRRGRLARLCRPPRSEQAFLSTSYESAGTTAELVAHRARTRASRATDLSPEQLLAVDRRAIFTAPDQHAEPALHGDSARRAPAAPHARLSGTAYVRTNRTRSVNGDQRDWAQCTAMPGVLCSQDDAGARDARRRRRRSARRLRRLVRRRRQPHEHATDELRRRRPARRRRARRRAREPLLRGRRRRTEPHPLPLADHRRDASTTIARRSTTGSSIRPRPSPSTASWTTSGLYASDTFSLRPRSLPRRSPAAST